MAKNLLLAAVIALAGGAADAQTPCGEMYQPTCGTVDALYQGEAGKALCPGRQSYFSWLKGGSCWSCPNGYMRTVHPMDHPKACCKRGHPGRGPWTPATFQKLASGCPEEGQFQVAAGGGTCYACPPGFSRAHVLGLDTRKCLPKTRCRTGVPAKQPPVKFKAGRPDIDLQAMGKLFLSFTALPQLRPGVCVPPFDIKEAAKRDIPNYSIKLRAMDNLGKELLKDARERKRGSLRALLKAKSWREAGERLNQMPAFRAFADTVRDAGDHSVSVGVAGDIQVVVGVNTEVGVAYDLVEKRFEPYQSWGLSKGVSGGVDVGIDIGVWQGVFESSCAQGIAVSVGDIASAGKAFWYSYQNGREQPHLVGVTRTLGAGVGLEAGEYNEVCTWLLPGLES